jgi:toxin ParE1/3/4
MSYLLSREAEGDLVEIYDRSLDDWGEAQADKYLDGLYAAFASLSVRPLAGRIRPEIGIDIRSRLCGSHVIFYMIQPKRVDILRILHQARDLGPAFGEHDD